MLIMLSVKRNDQKLVCQFRFQSDQLLVDPEHSFVSISCVILLYFDISMQSDIFVS